MHLKSSICKQLVSDYIYVYPCHVATQTISIKALIKAYKRSTKDNFKKLIGQWGCLAVVNQALVSCGFRLSVPYLKH